MKFILLLALICTAFSQGIPVIDPLPPINDCTSQITTVVNDGFSIINDAIDG
jgi:hypothetical protein